MRRTLLVLVLLGLIVVPHPAKATTDIACSVGAFKPAAYGTAQVRGVGDVDCWAGAWQEMEVWVRIKVDSELSTAVYHSCYNTDYCSWYRILTKHAGYHCYRTVADATVRDWNDDWFNLPSITSGALCTT